MATSEGGNPAEAFSRMFADMFAAMGQAPASAPDPMQFGRKMQQAFFDAMARQCDEFMRSEQYLEMMKQSMDGAIAFRQQLDRFLTQARDSMPGSGQDAHTELLAAMQQMERRINERLDELEQRLDGVEDGAGSKPASPRKRTSKKPRSGSKPSRS